MPDLSADEPLAFVPTTPNVPSLDGFDMESWLRGARSARRTVRIYSRPDLIADLDRIKADVEALPDGADAAALAVEFAQVRADLEASAIDVIVGKRSSEWVQGFRRDKGAELGYKVDANGDPAERDQLIDLNLHQLSAQIVAPAISHGQLVRMREVLEGAVTRLIGAMFAVNLDPAPDVVESPDFSRRRSATMRR